MDKPGVFQSGGPGGPLKATGLGQGLALGRGASSFCRWTGVERNKPPGVGSLLLGSTGTFRGFSFRCQPLVNATSGHYVAAVNNPCWRSLMSGRHPPRVPVPESEVVLLSAPPRSSLTEPHPFMTGHRPVMGGDTP